MRKNITQEIVDKAFNPYVSWSSREIEDSQRIKEVIAKEYPDITLTIGQCKHIWASWSEDMYCAGWLTLGEDDNQIIKAFEWFVTEQHKSWERRRD